ncbi:hypothetical protein OHB10_20125 [Streptomyces sp. NBC_01597]|uniref:hypothetical protein n=1 Tax=Streptomyces sp. NBC_01597 TaxID=2975891 RepID=UPI00386FC732
MRPASCVLRPAREGVFTNFAESPKPRHLRRSSGSGTYPFKASITWKVTWTDSADPDGPARQPALPDGLSTFEQNVAVKEIQSVNR